MVRLMVCLDSSADAHKVFEHCLAVVGRAAAGGAAPEVEKDKETEADEVVLVGVAEVYRRSSILNVLLVDFDFQILDKANKSIIKGTTEMLDEFKKELEKRGVNASVVVEAGDPRDKLCELAERVQPDLLVMGHHATALGLGSVALHCIEHAPSPVFIVRV